MRFQVCEWMNNHYQDLAWNPLAEKYPADIHFPFRVHLINAFGYREEWAKALLDYVKFNEKDQAYFGINPETPEAHRHKFLTTLCLSKNSPGEWKIADRKIKSADFVEAILQGPLSAWGDHSIFPEASWTLQFLSAFLDEKGNWQNQSTPLADVTRDSFIAYLQDYQSGNLYERGKTQFTESGLHLLEAINKLLKAQGPMIVEAETGKSLDQFYPLFKNHFIERFSSAIQESQRLLKQSIQEVKVSSLISNVLVLGHLSEVAVHPRGILAQKWDAEEITHLELGLAQLSKVMELFWQEALLSRLDAEQQKAYHFPLFHAYHALKLFEDLNVKS